MTLITFRCDGATLPEIGTGHVIRDLTLANALVWSGVCRKEDILFAVRGDGPYAIGADIIRRSGFSSLSCADSDLDPQGSTEGKTLSETGAGLIIFDRLATDRTTVEVARAKNAKIVSFDDLGAGADVADLVINAILHSALDASDSRLEGYSYFILPENTPAWHQRIGPVKRVLVSFGGYDRNNFSGQFLDAIPRLCSNAQMDVIVGAVEGETLDTLTEKIVTITGARVSLHHRPKNFGAFIDAADMAVVAGGLTVFQCIAAGVPSIGFSQYDHQRETLKRLAEFEAIENGDLYPQNQDVFVDSVNKLLSSDILRYRLSEVSARTIDHDGLSRVIAAINKLLSGEVGAWD